MQSSRSAIIIFALILMAIKFAVKSAQEHARQPHQPVDAAKQEQVLRQVEQAWFSNNAQNEINAAEEHIENRDYQTAEKIYTALIDNWNANPTRRVNPYLASAYARRARLRQAMKRPTEALADMDEAVSLGMGDEVYELRSERALLLARTGNTADAVAEASAVTDNRDSDGITLYNAARTFSLASVAIQNDDKHEEAKRMELSEQYAAHAVELLVKTTLASFFNEQATVEWLRRDPDLTPLRSRADYQERMGPVEKRFTN